MGKGLLVKNADFSVNALDKVEIDEEIISCTSVQLSQMSLTFDSFDTQKLTATVTPSNTTDTLKWSSADTSIATVSNGVITPQKKGSTTVTATCGSCSASCTVEVTVSSYAFLVGYSYVTGTTNAVEANTKRMIGYGTVPTVKLPTSAEYDVDFYPIVIPTGSTKIKVTMPGIRCGAQYFNVSDSTVTWVSEISTSSDLDYREMDIPSGVNGVILNMRKQDSTLDITSSFDVSGFSVEFE